MCLSSARWGSGWETGCTSWGVSLVVSLVDMADCWDATMVENLAASWVDWWAVRKVEKTVDLIDARLVGGSAPVLLLTHWVSHWLVRLSDAALVPPQATCSETLKVTWWDMLWSRVQESVW